MDWTPAAFLQSGPAHPVPLDMLLMGTFGPDYVGWEPETLWREIQLEFSATPPVFNRDCIQALRAVHQSTAFAEDWVVFEKVVAGLNNEPVLFDIMQRPTVGQLAAAMDVLRFVREVTLSEQVHRYVAAVVQHDAVSPIPRQLDFCRDLVPRIERNENGRDDEEYVSDRWDLMRSQVKPVRAWLGRGSA